MGIVKLFGGFSCTGRALSGFVLLYTGSSGVVAYESSFDLTAWYANAYNTSDDYLSKSDVGLRSDIEFSFSDGSDMFVSGQVVGDLGGRLEVGDPTPFGDRKKIAGSNNVLAELRELYLRTDVFDSLLTVGKQQIAWGQADGVSVLDIVNPLRYREFVLDDLESSRIPLWSFNYEIQFESFDLQLIWVVDQTYSEIPNSKSEFTITSPRYSPNYREPYPARYSILPVDKPDRAVADSDFGFELSRIMGDWDVSLNYLNHISDAPVITRNINYSDELPLITIREGYERTEMFGSNANTSFGDFVFRSEWAYSTDRFVIDYDVLDEDGVFKTEEVNYVLGLDFFGFEAAMLSVQLYQSRLLDYKNTLSRERNNTIYTFLYRATFLNETWNTEVQWLHNENDRDGLVRVSGDYRITDIYTASIGVDVFYGDPIGVLGQYEDNDRVHFKVMARF